MSFQRTKLPIYPQLERFPRSPCFLVEAARWIVYVLRLFSIGAWLLPFFQRTDGGKQYGTPLATELYQLAATLVPFLLLVLDVALSPTCATIICAVLLAEIIQYQAWNVVVRPELDRAYKRYSTSRTLMIIVLQYLQATCIYAIVYLRVFLHDFYVPTQSMDALSLSAAQAFEFSAVTITTVGYGSIHARPGSTAALFASSEAMLGVFALGVMVATVVSGLRDVKEVRDK